jgi:uncharacterized protein YidB (DUF937 family)
LLGEEQQEAAMGMLDDILKSIQGAPGGVPVPGGLPAPSGQDRQGMSSIAKLLLALLAIYAVKNVRRAPAGQPGGQPVPAPSGQAAPSGGNLPGGGWGDLLKGPLGGLLAGAGAGSLLGGLDNLLKQIRDSGQSRAADSWVSRDANQPISEGDLAKALGSDTLDALANQSGLPRDQVLSGLRQHLPRFVDQLTPEGRLPTENEWQRMV